MPVNSREKGKRGEREAVKYLKSLGFADAKRTQQYNGLGRGDVECPESLPCLNIEVKYGYPISAFDLGTQALTDACSQAISDAKLYGNWVVLWKPKGLRQWRATYQDDYGAHATLADDESISALFRSMV